MTRALATLLFLLPSAISSSPAKVGLFTCEEMLAPGAHQIVIDGGHLIKTRMMLDLDDDAVLRLSRLIRSDMTTIEFRRGLFGTHYQVRADKAPAGVDDFIAWVSNRQRDGVCAIELEAEIEGRPVHEFMQILAIYPDGMLALGLPNTEDRVGLILLLHEEPPAAAPAAPPTVHDALATA